VSPISGEGVSPVQLIKKYPQYEVPSKFQEALKVVQDLLNQGQKVILWTTFVFNIQMLQLALKDINPLIVYGAVPKDDSEDIEFNREQQIRKFKESSLPVLLIANPAACAESISLHKVCHHAVYLDRTFNCGQYLQSLDRIHRIGLAPDETVTYHLLIAKKTIDETIDRRLREKERNMIRILEDELPVGSFDVEDQQLGQSEDEEKVDFDETIKDIKRYLDNEVVDS
jgi:SNF2 family DNA or RNA helicase